jgi:hypothetical protein
VSHLRIAFVGQCHTVGYPGVPADAAFPEVCRNAVQAARPELKVELVLKPYYHPLELPAVVRAALRSQPRVVVIEVIGWLAVTGGRVIDLSRLPRRIRSTFQRVQHLRRAARVVSDKTRQAGPIYDVRTNALGIVSDVLRPLFPRYPRPTVAEYESAVSGAISAVYECPGIAVVVQGPGAPNFTLDSPGIAPDAIERYRAVNAMSRRVAASHNALFVERWDTVAAGFYLPGNIKPAMAGHSVWGHLLASELLGSGIV